jgi:hypothetical protein
VELIRLEPCPNCGGTPEVNVKYRKKSGNLYWVNCPTCEYTACACNDERAARTWWNKNLTGRMDGHAWRRIDCVPTKVLEKLLEIASSDAKEEKESLNYSYNWIWAELSLVMDARKRIPELEHELANLGNGVTKWYRQAELTTNLATLRKTATHVTPAAYDWMMHIICKKFLEGE